MRYKRSALMDKRLSENRRLIFQAARALITDGGFKQAKVNAIAERAGISTGLIYRYFTSKPQLLLEILADAAKREIVLLNQAYAAFPSARACLALAIRTFVSRALAAPQLSYALIAEPVVEEVIAERIRWRNILTKHIQKILIKGIEQEELKVMDTGVVAACMIGAMTEAIVNQFIAQETTESETEALINTVVAFCLDAVLKT